jgi:hypothetical protein
LLPCQRGGISKLPKITILRWLFHSNWFQSDATSQWIEIESKAFQRWLGYLKVEVKSCLASQKSMFVFEMWGSADRFQQPKMKGAHPPSGTTLVYLFDRRWRRKKVITFLNTISQRKTSVWSLNRAFLPFEDSKGGGWKGEKRF